MWLATKHGFFSVVCGQDAAGNFDGSRLCIRARKRQHLENLQSMWVKHCGGPSFQAAGQFPTICLNAGTDYPFRIVVETAFGRRLIELLAIGIDYSNFKDAAAAAQPDDIEYRVFLSSTWTSGIAMESPVFKMRPSGRFRGGLDPRAAARADRCDVNEADDPLE